ncbi:MAG: hypothetical protein E7261_01825 [Lachnospiraceae bacterium]|nr:hypothetical protein [Lachnospiraceae bacterium]
MDGKIDRKAFAAIHDLKNDAVRLSGHVDRLEAVALGEVSDRDTIITDFLAEYEAFLEKYENSVNDKIQAFIVEIKGIVTGHRSELAGIGLEVADGRLALFDSDCLIVDAGAGVEDKSDSVFALLDEALLNAEVHMERFIPEKYLSYDRQRDYRILKQEGNIYTKEV